MPSSPSPPLFADNGWPVIDVTRRSIGIGAGHRQALHRADGGAGRRLLPPREREPGQRVEGAGFNRAARCREQANRTGAESKREQAHGVRPNIQSTRRACRAG